MKGSRQPCSGPTSPASSWPEAMPSPIEKPSTAQAAGRLRASNQSPTMEKARGSAPPRPMPVSARHQNSCS